MTSMDHKRLYYVVQFIDLPFKNIDDYVCVPSSWVTLNKSFELKGNVTYPANEDPSETRGRVKRRQKPNDDWRFYPAFIKYESENYKKAKHWISRNTYFESDEEELGNRDTQRKPEQNRKSRRKSSGSNSDKPELTLKTDKSPQILLPKIFKRQLMSQKSDKNLNKHLKLDENPKPGVVTEHTTAASGCSKQKQSIIITDSQVIQEGHTKTSSDFNGKVNTDQNTQSVVVKEKQSVKMPIESISSKLSGKQLPHQPLTEQQQSRQPPTEQQQSRQPPSDPEPSLQPSIDRQPSPKLMATQNSSSKLLEEQQPSVDQDYQQSDSMSTVDFRRNSIEMADNQSNMRSENIIDSIISTSHDDSNLVKLSQMLKLDGRKLFLVMKKLINSVDGKISHEDITKNIPTVQHPRLKKTVVAQATETDSMMDVDPNVETTAGSTISKSASNVVESTRQTDESLRKEETSFCKETASDSSEYSSEIELENEVVPTANQTILTAGQNHTQENKNVEYRLFKEDMMDVFITLFTQMDANLAVVHDMFDCLRNSIVTCTQTHKTLLKKVMKFNSIEPYQISTSPPNNVLSQAIQEIPAEDNDNTTSEDNSEPSIREQRGTFSLPAEYDPNDTKWTLKYRKNKPGLVELIPQTGVYVKKKELKRCIRESNDCRTLARLLLTEVFSQNALSVCSWTGSKAKAFNSVNIDVRPGLDANARMVLLSFVEEHGKKHGWNTSNTLAVMTTIRTKIKDIRDKHEKKFNA